MKKLLSVEHLSQTFTVKNRTLKAVSDLSFSILKGQTLGLVGESGCGKTTAAKTILRLLEPSAGKVFFEHEEITAFSQDALKAWRKQASLIFQDPYASLNPRMTAEDIVREPFAIHRQDVSKEQIAELFKKVQLSPSLMHRFPHEFSGGQRQRIGIARALALVPKLDFVS